MCIKLVIWKSLYYDARSEKHQIIQIFCRQYVKVEFEGDSGMLDKIIRGHILFYAVFQDKFLSNCKENWKLLTNFS